MVNEKKDHLDEDIKEDENLKLDEEIIEDEGKEEEDQQKNETQATGDIENELRDNLIRLQADFQNYKRRSEREKQGSIDYGIEKIVCQLLPVIDNFERALDAKEDKTDALYEGVEMIYKQMIEVLKNNNIEEINSIDEKFDPNFHHAIGVERVEGKDSDMVIDILQKGYVLKEKVIRPAMVRVSE